MTTTEEKREGERRTNLSVSSMIEFDAIRPDQRTVPDRRATERERQQKHYGAMLEDARDMVDAKKWRALVSAFNEISSNDNN